MSDDAGRTVSRHWAMLRSVPRSPLKITTRELEARLNDEGFKVSRRTLERDLHLLSSEFPLVMDDRSRPYGWSWARDARIEFMPRLAVSQAVALLLASSHLRELLPQTMLKDLAPMFDVAKRSLSTTGWKDWSSKTAVVPMGVARIPPKLSLEVLAVVQSGVARGRCLEVAYRPKGTQVDNRYLAHPLGLLVRGPVLYLVCTLFDYDDVRELALHRMKTSLETGQRAKTPQGFDFQDYARTTARRYGADGTVRLTARFHSTAAEHLRETPLSQDQSLLELTDGRIELTATVQNDDLLRWWLLGFGRWVEVTSPAALRSEIAEELRLASHAYENKAS